VCCGNDYDGLEAAIAAPGEEGVMAKVFTTVPGSVQDIGRFGRASNDEPAVVPEAVASEFEGQPEFRVERDAAPAAPKKAEKPEKAGGS
jgi:hypothetical protein